MAKGKIDPETYQPWIQVRRITPDYPWVRRLEQRLKGRAFTTLAYYILAPDEHLELRLQLEQLWAVYDACIYESKADGLLVEVAYRKRGLIGWRQRREVDETVRNQITRAIQQSGVQSEEAKAAEAAAA